MGTDCEVIKMDSMTLMVIIKGAQEIAEQARDIEYMCHLREPDMKEIYGKMAEIQNLITGLCYHIDKTPIYDEKEK
jgi:hypothetical protein